MEIEKLGCCAIAEIQNLGDFRDNLYKALKIFSLEYGKYQNITGAFVIFSEVRKYHLESQKNDYGQRFAKLITKHKLGRVIATNTKTNPNSDNKVRAYLWEVNHKALDKFRKEHANISTL